MSIKTVLIIFIWCTFCLAVPWLLLSRDSYFQPLIMFGAGMFYMRGIQYIAEHKPSHSKVKP